jgi:hypothetical protein
MLDEACTKAFSTQDSRQAIVEEEKEVHLEPTKQIHPTRTHKTNSMLKQKPKSDNIKEVDQSREVKR